MAYEWTYGALNPRTLGSHLELSRFSNEGLHIEEKMTRLERPRFRLFLLVFARLHLPSNHTHTVGPKSKELEQRFPILYPRSSMLQNAR